MWNGWPSLKQVTVSHVSYYHNQVTDLMDNQWQRTEKVLMRPRVFGVVTSCHYIVLVGAQVQRGIS